jgi:HD-GYP domain-containing protein (c-di-GMP phosphodiesterase class II)
MRAKAIAAFGTSSAWVVSGALLLALISIAVITTLQHRANESSDAQVTLTQIAREFDALQSAPYDSIGGDAVAHAVVRARMRAAERRIETRLVSLQREAPTRHLWTVAGPYRANTAVLERIRVFVVRDQQARYDELGPVAGRLQRAAIRELDLASVDYQRRASRAQRLGTLGSAATILLLVSLFGNFYLRSRRAGAHAETLARENAQLLVQDSQLLVVQRLALAGEYRDDDTGQHTGRVARLSGLIGAALGMPADERDLLEQAAPLHDVGKIGIPDCILLKPGRLTPDEVDEMQAHTTLGAAMLSRPGFPLLDMAEVIALTHHERWDGSGYPAGLAGEDIPLVGRIVAVADVFDALTHARPYKEAWPVAEAIAEIRGEVGGQFDPAVVNAFLGVLADLPASEGDEPASTATPTAVTA